MKRFVLLFAILITIVSLVFWNSSIKTPEKTTSDFLKSIQKGKWKSASKTIGNSDAKEYFLEETRNKYNQFVFQQTELK